MRKFNLFMFIIVVFCIPIGCSLETSQNSIESTEKDNDSTESKVEPKEVTKKEVVEGTPEWMMMHDLEKAVKENNVEKFMRYQNKENTLFYNEQRRWIEEAIFKKKEQNFEFELTLTDFVQESENKGTVKFTVMMSKNNKKVYSKNTVVYETIKVNNVWLLNDVPFETMKSESGHIIVQYKTEYEEMAKQVLTDATDLVRFYSENFRWKPSPITIKIYASREEISATIPSVGRSNWNEFGEAVKITDLTNNKKVNTFELLAHELTHKMLGDLSNDNLSFYFQEGFGTYLQHKVKRNSKGEIYFNQSNVYQESKVEFEKDELIFTFEELNNIDYDIPESSLLFRDGFLIANYLVLTHGLDKFLEMLDHLSNHEYIDKRSEHKMQLLHDRTIEALEKVYGSSDELSIKYEDYYIKKEEQPVLKPTQEEKIDFSTLLKGDFFYKNRQNFIEEMKNNSVAALFSENTGNNLITDPSKKGPNRNFYYVSGLPLENSALLIEKRGNFVKETLFIPDISSLSNQKITELTKIKNIERISTFSKVFNKAIKEQTDYIYVEKEINADNEPKALKRIIRIGKEKKVGILNSQEIIGTLRAIKSQEELEWIKEAVAITSKGIQSIMNVARNEINERELENTFIASLKEDGVNRMGFDAIIASEKNALELHYNENNKVAPRDSLLVVDVGAEYGFYGADITRTFPIDGTFTERQKQLYEIVLKAQKETIAAVRPGVTLIDLQELTKKILAEELLKIGMINQESEVGRYYTHTVSHHLGLETHDIIGTKGRDAYGFNVKLEPGMVIAVEPGLYIKEEGIGIRIEDDLLVTSNGFELLSKDLIKEVNEIEQFMKEN